MTQQIYGFLFRTTFFWIWHKAQAIINVILLLFHVSAVSWAVIKNERLPISVMINSDVILWMSEKLFQRDSNLDRYQKAFFRLSFVKSFSDFLLKRKVSRLQHISSNIIATNSLGATRQDSVNGIKSQSRIEITSVSKSSKQRSNFLNCIKWKNTIFLCNGTLGGESAR